MSYFLRNSSGFFLQFASLMALYLIPFPPQSFRLSPKWAWIGCGVLGVLSSVLFPFLMYWVMPQIESFSPIANLYMLFWILVFIAVYFWIIREALMKKLLVVFLVFFYGATQLLLVNLFTPLFPGGVLSEVYPPLALVLYAVTTAVLFPLGAGMMRKVMREYLSEIETDNIRREFGLVLTVTLLYAVLLFTYTSPVRLEKGVDWWSIAPPMLFAIVIMSLFYWTFFRESVRRKRESEIRRTMKIQQLQYEKIIGEMENSRRVRHDMRHYLNGLYNLLEQNRVEDMKTYLSEVIESVTRRENEIYCQNMVVNGLLQYYVGLARSEGIQCSVQAQCGDLEISSTDLTVMFGNAMENAIRACRTCEADRWIAIQIGLFGGSFMVQISNSCQEIHPSGSYRLDDGFLPAEAFISTRVGGGYGLGSLSHTAQKYGGDARFQFDAKKKVFTARIRLNLHPEML